MPRRNRNARSRNRVKMLRIVKPDGKKHAVEKQKKAIGGRLSNA